jgi:hypothetical protein
MKRKNLEKELSRNRTEEKGTETHKEFKMRQNKYEERKR